MQIKKTKITANFVHWKDIWTGPTAVVGTVEKITIYYTYRKSNPNSSVAQQID
jgi:hypothetical protein